VRSLGAFAYLKKPVDRDALFSAIEAAISPHLTSSRTTDH
jgi:FixJ family two-component response regulator